jgi:hypothetical protein
VGPFPTHRRDSPSPELENAMYRWVILSVLVVAVTAGSTIALQYLPESTGSPVPAARPADETGPPPSIVLEDETNFQFGEMAEFEERTKTWKIRNDGPGDLRLVLDDVSCTCTNVRFDDNPKKIERQDKIVIPAGTEKVLHYTWNPRDKQGQHFHSEARFSTNDYEKKPSLVFSVEGQVIPSVVVAPPDIQLVEISSEEPTKISVLVYSPSKEDMKIVETPRTSRGEFITTTVNDLTAEELKSLEEQQIPVKKGYRVDVEIKPGLPLGRFKDALVIETDHPSRPRIDIPIDGKIVGPISSVPSTVSMVGISGKTGGQKQVRVNVRGQAETNFTVELPEALRDSVRVKIEPEGPASEGPVPVRLYNMTVEILPGTKAGTKAGTILLKTDHPNASEVKIPLQAFIKAG